MSSTGIEKRGSAATVKACDSCRRRKRKCVWAEGSDGCIPCRQLKEPCERTHIRKPRAKSQRRSRVAEYENRIQRLESLLEERSAAQPRVQEQPLQPADQSDPLSSWVNNLRTEVDSLPVQDVSGIAPFVSPEDYEPTEEEYLEPFSTESSLPQTTPPDDVSQPSVGFEPSTEFQDDAALVQDLTFESTELGIGFNPDDSSLPPAVVRSQCDAYLPPPALGTMLLKEFLVDFNTASPLYRPQVIANHFRICYLGLSDGSAVAWTSTYVVFGIAYRLRAMSATATPRDGELADYYLARTLATVSGLLLSPPSLGLVQCLLGVAYLIQTSSQSTPHARFVSTALRIAQSLAYNEEQSGIEGLGQDPEQQQRVFWMAFMKDTEESILSNAPNTHRRDDISAESPHDNPSDAAGAVTAAEGTWRVNIFSLRARLALIQAEAIEKVLSVKARKVEHGDVSQKVNGVLESLNTWRDHDLFKFSAEQLMQLLYQADVVHVLGLEASYFATVFRLQASLILDPRTNPFSSDALAKLAAQSKHPSFKEAKRLLNILAVAPQGDIGICWMIKLPVIAAFVTVVANLIHSSPEMDPAPSCMREFHRIISMLGTLVQRSQDVELAKGRDLCMRLFSQLETGRRVKWLHDQTAGGREINPAQLGQGAFGGLPQM
ncbi:hypothetical protein BS50DRAFT_569629 [Corynespora cassiicola Philippines]|uniref:Zn(2)-C6 fungal-type domain-containing protein n=1 Tax=Corynespora cassiicola Philippines TaxID=1448308 RepID=A0A2T2P2Z7_CORCC|nr:hypothetical protein BS50DRAFT_569629 [Corynespora cassiicola Philippines]